LEHGLVHEHLSQQHEGEGATHHHEEHQVPPPVEHDHDSATASGSLASVVRTSSDDHAHGHPQLDAIRGARELIRLPVGQETIALVPDVLTLQAALHTPRPRARASREVLARPDPESGPPPNPRAPPAR